MTNMVEKVAKAILVRVPSGYGMTEAEADEYARAAIEAMMEPTSWMFNEAVQIAEDQDGNVSGYEYWQRMIDAALKEEGQ